MITRLRRTSPTASIARRAGRWLAVAIAFACPMALAAPARAGLMIQVQDFTTLGNGTGTFDLVLVNDGPDTYNVSTDVVEIAIVGATGAVFSDATTATALTYIYATSFADANGIPLYAGTPGTDLVVIDTESADPLYRVVAPGESYGLAHVTFQDDPNAPLTAAMIAVVADGTTISDEDGNIIYPAAIPEPSSLVSLAVGILVAIGSARRLRGRVGRGRPREDQESRPGA